MWRELQRRRKEGDEKKRDEYHLEDEADVLTSNGIKKNRDLLYIDMDVMSAIVLGRLNTLSSSPISFGMNTPRVYGFLGTAGLNEGN